MYAASPRLVLTVMLFAAGRLGAEPPIRCEDPDARDHMTFVRPSTAGQGRKGANQELSAPPGPSRVRLVLTIESPSAISPRVAAGAAAEAAAIWSRYGVDVLLSAPTPCRAAPVDVVALDVVVASRRGDRVDTLGEIRFSPDGDPGEVITVYHDEIVRIATGAKVGDAPEPRWPVAREDVMARVLGRVLAHELGHYLLRSRAHTKSGLMRSVQPLPDLRAGPLELFQLSNEEVERLDGLLGPT
jgi:hypothetical protein